MADEMKHCKWYNDEFCTNDKSPCVADYCPVVEYPELCKCRELDNEKKLTDEEIAKDIKANIKYMHDNGFDEILVDKEDMQNYLNLIHRLQGEIKQLKDEKEEIRLFNLAIQNSEVDMRIESEMAKSFYNSIIQIFEQNGAKNFFTTTIDIEGKKGRYAFTIEKVGGQTVAEKLAEQKAEIERLTEESDEMFDRHAKENQAASILIEKRNNEIAELQKQVDEQDKEIDRLEKVVHEQAEQYYDCEQRTAKEILQGLEERKERVKAFYGTAESVGVDIAIRAVKEIVKRKGVEVE